MPSSSVARQLAAAPMMILPIRIEHALNMAVQGSHDADPREHRWPSQFGDRHQALNRGLPTTRCTMPREGREDSSRPKAPFQFRLHEASICRGAPG
jgi:hypothetical protein